jgi:16S rRNA processing protein RimM
MVIVKFKGIDDMDAAEALKNLYLKVDRKSAVKLPEDAFFICDLIGCEVLEESGRRLGMIKDVLKTGSNDVYFVEDEDKKTVLIPALKAVVREVSVKDRRMVVKLPEGLMDDEI